MIGRLRMTNQTHKNNTTMMSSINQHYTIDTVIIRRQKGIVGEQWNAAEFFFLPRNGGMKQIARMSTERES